MAKTTYGFIRIGLTRTIIISLLIIFFSFYCYSSLTLASESDSLLEVNGEEVINIEGEDFTVNYLKVPLDGSYNFETSLAGDTIGRADDLSSLAETKDNSVAAINGTYFDAYTEKDDERFPYGNLMIDGEAIFTTGEGATAGFVDNLEPVITRADVTPYIELEDDRERRVLVNHPTKQESTLVLYTHHFTRNIIERPGLKLQIKDDTVTDIIDRSYTGEDTSIPDGGNLLYLGTGYYGAEDLFSGMGFDIRYEVHDKDQGEKYCSKEKGLTNMVGAGPKLVTNGQVDVDIEGDMAGNYDTHTERSSRSFIGYDQDKTHIIMGTVNLATQYESAEIANKLGLHEAMSLDGGASSGLYHDGDYLTSPGRKISNALVVTKSPSSENSNDESEMDGVDTGEAIEDEASEDFDADVAESANVISMIIGEKELTLKKDDVEETKDLDVSPVIKEGRTLVPLRGFFEAIDAEVDYLEETREIVIDDSNTLIKMTLDDNIALVDDVEIKMDTSPDVIEGRAMLPLRFVSEKLGYSVEWIEENNEIVIQGY
ncbi:stalk domain-containing protein [Natranaerofaba carboxydovora]|uniref:stalk domain-containing protein n=1 Tax=Natranaerofaba carboxydovora TaxID=2742683 RepID=UPI001F13E3A8|nr:stalk domain-containing protein [Natranaerofaba carboxydovora]UMZ74968.1 hypothetical protein ACONDI_02574 [Natranaerofaba carboxydovora]